MSSKIGIGLIGMGVMGQNHARVLASLDGVEFSGFSDPVVGDDSLPGIRRFNSAEELLGSGIHGCVIASPTETHEQLATMAASFRVSVLIEKPVALDTESGRRIQVALDSAGVVGVVGHIERFNPAVIAMRQRIESGEAGDMYQLATRRQGPFPERIRDVGVVMDLATHDIDLTRWVTGEEYAAISAWTAHKSGRSNEDLVIAAGTLESGLVVSHHVNWLSAAKERQTVLTTERGTYVADTLNADFYHFENAQVVEDWPALAQFRGVGEGNMTRYALHRREPLRAELEAFRDAIQGGREPAVPIADGLAAVTLGERILESARSRRSE